MHRIDLIRLRDTKIVRRASRHGRCITIIDALSPEESYSYECADDADAIAAMRQWHEEFGIPAHERPYDFTVLYRS